MKPLLLCLILLATIQSNGQYYAEQKTNDYYDTVKTWITVIDTTQETGTFVIDRRTGFKGYIKMAISGYAVYLHTWVPEHQKGDGIYMGQMIRKFHTYIDDKKKKLPNRFVIID